ncbi:tripartite motif-containing protein 16-like protein isoform X2 [Myripristis murdjan]|uniref:tripartite motif-containing protein 16-like protein isoform X2 n=1 Tax=Myripristis murdjan TaxID=586833 RepID=UPI001176186A|nr:tripartite motif-containing protein 16-like protein isoform X2 [Myripristis murdjan]
MAEPHIPVKRDHLCCRICRTFLRNPATIPCGHNFCTLCIQESWDNKERNGYLFSCPECYFTFSSRPQLITNTTLAELVNDTQRGKSGAGSKTEQSCSAGSTGEPQTPKRPRTSIEQRESGSDICRRHRLPLEVYCCTDKQIICELCAFYEHNEHRTGLVSEERRRKQEGAREAEDYCESILVTIIDSLQRHYGSVRELIGAQERAAAAQVRKSLMSLQRKMEEIRTRDAELDVLAQVDKDAHFLQKCPSLTDLCENDNSHKVSEDLLLPFESTKAAVEQLGKQLQAFCDKEFAAISQTALSAINSMQTGKTTEPETRAEFLEYACELSLDPNTAHEHLVLSNGDKEVKHYPQKCSNPGACHPEQFIHRRQVLCKEGLQAERCYYEVEVDGDKAEIALTYKGIDRKSRTTLSAFGAKANSWSLDRSRTYSVSHQNDSVQLTTTPSHKRIGVYLKFREGTLSFYEVSDRMKFLYKIEATFTEPLYPGFWLGEKCCIRLCDLS